MLTNTGIKFTTLVSGEKIINAWKWLLSNLSFRANNIAEPGFVFDRKTWKFANYGYLSKDDSASIDNVHALYLASQFSGDPNDLVDISLGELKDIKLRTSKIEDGIRKIICDEDSFRYALSENLACWLQLATYAQTQSVSKYVVSLPNASPRDPGPDGLSLSTDQKLCDVIEIRSVKSAKNKDPKPLIVSTEFAKGGDADPTKQLDELFLICQGEHGFTKFDRLLTDIFYRMGRRVEDEYRAALIQKQSTLNAVVVADGIYAKAETFSAYKRIQRSPNERIAVFAAITKLHSTSWSYFWA